MLNLILWSIKLFGLELTVAEIVLLVGGICSVIGFLIWYKPEKLKRFAEAFALDQKVKEAKTDRELWFQEKIKEWTKQAQEVQRINNDKYNQLQKEHLETLRLRDEASKDYRRERQARQKLWIKLKIAHWETDKSGNLITANGQWLNMFGLTLEDAINTGWLNSIVKDEQEALYIDWQARIRDLNDAEPMFFTIDNKATGEQIKARAIFTISRDSDGNAQRIFGITEQFDNRR